MQTARKTNARPTLASCNPGNVVFLDQNNETILANKLRDAFADVLSAPIPDRFVELMEEIARKEQAK